MRIVFIGGGNMGAAMVGGLLARGAAPTDVTVVEPHAPAREALTEKFGVHTLPEAASWPAADVAVLAVKPQQMRAAVAALGAPPPAMLVVSIAAGVRIAALCRWLGGHDAVVRAMPNTPALVRAGITGLYAAPNVSEGHRRSADTLLRAVGDTVWLADESDLDAVTAVSGSGPAYVFYFIEALEQAGREMGLAPDAARQLAVQTFVGAATLAAARAEDPAVLRAQVTSKGGTTERAVAALDSAAVKAAFITAVKAARERSVELGEALGEG